MVVAYTSLAQTSWTVFSIGRASLPMDNKHTRQHTTPAGPGMAGMDTINVLSAAPLRRMPVLSATVHTTHHRAAHRRPIHPI